MTKTKKIKSIKEIKSKVKIIEKSSAEESELEEDIEESENKFREEAASSFSGISQFSTPLESGITASEPAETSIRRETREREELNQQNVTYASRTQETDNTYSRAYAPQTMPAMEGRAIIPDDNLRPRLARNPLASESGNEAFTNRVEPGFNEQKKYKSKRD